MSLEHQPVQQTELGANLKGPALEQFTHSFAQKATNLWEEINTARADANQNITTKDYRNFSRQAGNLGYNVLRLAINWYQGEDPVKKQLGNTILFSQVLDPVLKGINRFKIEHPEASIEEEDLIQEGIIYSLNICSQFRRNSQIPVAFRHISDSVYSHGRKMMDSSDEDIETYPLEKEILEKALSLPDTSEYIDPVASFKDPDDKKLDLDEALDEVLITLTPREQLVINRRFPRNGDQPAVLETIAKELGVTRERIRQIEEKAFRKLRHPSRSKRLRPESSNTSYEPPTIREQLMIRTTWKTVINAYLMEDAQRARHAIALLKANSLGFTRLSLIEDITKMLEDPYYPQVSDEIIDKYLQRFTGSYVSVRNSLRSLERGNEHISQEIRKMEHLVGKLLSQTLRESGQTDPASETIPNSSSSQPKTLSELLAAQEAAFQNGDFETSTAIQTEIAQRGLKPPTTHSTQTNRQTPNTSRQADNSTNRTSANKTTTEQTGSTKGSRESQQNPNQEQRPPVLRIKVPTPKSPTVEQRRNLITQRNIAAAAMLVFGIGLGFLLSRDGIGVVNEDKSGFNLRFYRPDNTLGLRLEWSDFGPLDTRNPIVIDGQPLQYPQITNRRWIEIGLIGVNLNSNSQTTFQPR